MTRKTEPVSPCIDCGTTGGYPEKGRTRPRRVHGRCNTCERRHNRAKPIAPCVECGDLGGSTTSNHRFGAPGIFRSRDGLCLRCSNRRAAARRAATRGVRPCKTCGDPKGPIEKGRKNPARRQGECLRCNKKKANRRYRLRRQERREREQVQVRTKLAHAFRNREYLAAKMRKALRKATPLAAEVVAEYRKATSWWKDAARILAPKVVDLKEAS